MNFMVKVQDGKKNEMEINMQGRDDKTITRAMMHTSDPASFVVSTEPFTDFA